MKRIRVKGRQEKNPFYELIEGKRTTFDKGLINAFKNNPKLLIESGKKYLDNPSLFMGEVRGVEKTENKRGEERREEVVLIKTKQGRIISLSDEEFDALCYISEGEKAGTIERKVNIGKRKVNNLIKVYSNLPSSVQSELIEKGKQLRRARKGRIENDVDYHNTRKRWEG